MVRNGISLAVSKHSHPSSKSFTWLLAASQRLQAYRGWRRAWIAFGFGALTALAFSPINFFPVLWISFPALVFLVRGAKRSYQAFCMGWCFAFGSFVFGFYWIAASMFVDLAHFWWAVPLSVAGLPAFFALYYGFALVLAFYAGLEKCSGIVLVALFWFLGDYVRGHLFTGFPWNLEGYTWVRSLPILQSVSLIGIYGLTLLTLIAAFLPACLTENNRRSNLILLSSVLVFCALFVWGETRLLQASHDFVPNVRLRLVQPNTDQAHKWELEEQENNFRKLLNLSAAAAEKPVTHIIWPETASTYYLAEEALARRAMAPYVPKGGVILTGVIRRIVDLENVLHYYNSMVAIDGQARLIAGYDKFHLVPFGEYIPMRSILPLRTLVHMGVDFTSGDGLRTLRVPGLPSFSPLVCYEAIFSGQVVDQEDRPHFIMNATNDGWYGHTSGPYQHFANVKVRSVEEGMPVVRAANTGISGVVDAYGNIIARLGYGRSGFIDSDLPAALPPTFFSQHDEMPLWSVFGILSITILFERLPRRKKRK